MRRQRMYVWVLQWQQVGEGAAEVINACLVAPEAMSVRMGAEEATSVCDY